MSEHRVRRLVGAGVATLALVGLVVARPYLFPSGASTVVPIEEIRDRYHEHTSALSLPTVSAVATPTVATLPRSGIYVYNTSGGDGVDALGGQQHQYPPTTTITVVPFGCGVLQRWDVLKERWEESQRCIAGPSVLQPARTTFDTFFGRSQTDTYTCAGSGRPVDASPGTKWTYTCQQGHQTDAYTGTVLGTETLTVGTDSVSTLHVQVTIDNGRADESQVTDSWLQLGSDLLIAQLTVNATSNSSPVGMVRYTEKYELHLVSLQPTT